MFGGCYRCLSCVKQLALGSKRKGLFERYCDQLIWGAQAPELSERCCSSSFATPASLQAILRSASSMDCS